MPCKKSTSTIKMKDHKGFLFLLTAKIFLHQDSIWLWGSNFAVSEFSFMFYFPYILFVELQTEVLFDILKRLVQLNKRIESRTSSEKESSNPAATNQASTGNICSGPQCISARYHCIWTLQSWPVNTNKCTKKMSLRANTISTKDLQNFSKNSPKCIEQLLSKS